MSRLRARCPYCRTLTAVALGPEYQCHSCGAEFAAGLVRVPRAWGTGGEAMAAAAWLELPYPEAGVIEEESLHEQTLALAVGLPERPLVLGGCCCSHVGAVQGLARRAGRLAVVWIDAHGDLNTPETSPSGNVHGMVLAAVLGLAGPEFESEDWVLPAIDPSRVALVGVRSLDAGERERLRALNARVYTMSDVDRIGVERCIRESLAHVAGPGFVHVSLDMDVVDPEVAPGVGTPVRGGLSYREAHLAMELVAESGLTDSLEVVEVNPILDRENGTAALAVELVASALGATIL